MTASVRVLTTQTMDSSPALLLIDPRGQRTLIQCGEGTQRSFLEHGQKLSSVTRVCLTHIRHDSVGGLPGMMLTSADAAKAAHVAAATTVGGGGGAGGNQASSKSSSSKALQLDGLELLGPATTTRQYVRSLRHFCRRDDFPIAIREGAFHQLPAAVTANGDNPEGPRSTKKKRKRQQQQQGSNNHNNTPSPKQPQHYFGVQSIPVPYTYQLPSLLVPQTSTNGTGSHAHETIPVAGDYYVSFVFTTPATAGKFLPQNAQALGIPPGKLYAQLKAGRAVHFQDATSGQVRHVESSEVVLPPTPGRIVAVLCYPTLDVWKALAETDALTSILSSPPVPPPAPSQSTTNSPLPPPPPPVLELVVHMTPRSIFQHADCHTWRQQLGTDVQHLFLETADPHSTVVANRWQPSHSQTSRSTPLPSSSTPSSGPSPFTSACVGAMVRSQLEPTLYATPNYLKRHLSTKGMTTTNAGTTATPGTPGTSTTTGETNSNVRTAVPLLDYLLMPVSRKGYTEGLALGSSSNQTPLDQYCREKLEALVTSGAQEHAQNIVSQLLATQTTTVPPNPKEATPVTTSQAQILFTGTGSAIPCKHRNVTGMCLTLDHGQSMLLDVGEGTIGQLLRASLSSDEEEHGHHTATLLQNIKAVWISHPHADHHLGLLRLLADRQAAIRYLAASASTTTTSPILDSSDTSSTPTKKPAKGDALLVIAPPPILQFLREYQEVEPGIASSYIGVDCRDLQRKPDGASSSSSSSSALSVMPRVMKDNSLFQENGITSIEAVPVAHCPYSYAVIVDTGASSFGKVVYSGDCRPCHRLAQQAQGADILIHEATFENGMEAEAAMKRHSTVGEALRIAQEMQAKTLVLTHFSQRYPKIPPLRESDNANHGNDNGNGTTSGSGEQPTTIPVIFAFDFMTLTPANLLVASKLTPALRRLYPEEKGEDTSPDEDGGKAMNIPGFFAQNPYQD